MSKSNDVYDFVINRLISADYKFGERLLVKELGEETGASRQPIMSALNRLSTEGFVRIIPQVGCQVIDPSREEIADFFLLFRALEGLLVELAAERRTEDDLLELNLVQQRVLAVSRAAEPSPEKYTALNRAFHRTLHSMARSPLLERKQRNNFNMSDFFITHSVGFGALIPEAVQEHNQIIEAITQQDAERARKESEAHIGAVATAVLNALDAA